MVAISKRPIIFLLSVLISYSVSGQQAYDLSKISEEKIIIDSRLVTGHEGELRCILLLSIWCSLWNNLVANVTVMGPASNEQQYLYLVVSPDFSVEAMRKAKIRLEYEPSNPAAIQIGDLAGYVRYHDFDVQQECSDIAAALEILEAMDNIEGRQQPYDLSMIAEEKIIINSRLIMGHERELHNMLIQAIRITLDNIANIDATGTRAVGSLYQYHYLVVSHDFSVSVKQKEKAVSLPPLPPGWEYGPDNGIVYISFNIENECQDINEMILILGELYNIDLTVKTSW
jgi:flagellar basal body rod protein FlgC